MTTAANWVFDTERKINAGARQKLNKLNGAISSTTVATLTVEFDTDAIKGGAQISIDLEDMYVWSVAGQTVTVERGVNGTTPATHVDDSLVYVNPKASKSAVLQALNQSILALSSAGMYHMATVDLTFDANTAGYNLTSVTSIKDVYMVEAKNTGLTGDWREVRDYDLDRDQSTTDFASGYSLRFEGGQQGQLVRVHYKQPFVQLTDLSTDVTATLLPTSAYDMPATGAAARLITPREMGRNYTGSQGDTRRAEEVPSRAIAASAADQWREWDHRLGEELLNLAQLYPEKQVI